MGYTHYWYRDKTIKPQPYKAIVNDFRKLLPVMERQGVKLASGDGEGYPLITDTTICFNGSVRCGHPKNTEIKIPWPSAKASGIGDNKTAIDGQWFAGVQLQTRCCDGDCSYESLFFPKTQNTGEGFCSLVTEISYYKEDGTPAYSDPKHVGKIFSFCKTAFRPYDWAVTAFLIIAKHYLKDTILISSDGELPHWHDAMLLCQLELGYGMDFRLDK